MAVNVNTVYQRVLAIANKEQRGYITPQEFNLFANQAQIDIFEQYFYDINQFNRLPGNSTEYSDVLSILEEKIAPFKTSNTSLSLTEGTATLSSEVYLLGEVLYKDDDETYSTVVAEVNSNEMTMYKLSPLARPTIKNPAYAKTGANEISIFPTTLGDDGDLTYNYVRKPNAVAWAYIVVNGSALYNSSASVNFELHQSEEVNLVNKILTLSGIMMKDPSLYQTASAEEVKDIQQEKQ